MQNMDAAIVPDVLIASGDNEYAGALALFLEPQSASVERCHDPQGVLRLIGLRHFDIVILDIDLCDGAGLDLVTFIKRQSPDSQIVLLFELAKVDQAIEGIRRGAFFYLPKTCEPSDVALVVDKALNDTSLQATVKEHEQHIFEELIGGTPAMRRVIELIQKVSPTDSTVLLLGESGTGKEVVANMIHRLSSRRDKPFIAINCAALPEQLLESELFGHIKGAFTGAETDKIGLFEEADGGTLFLDEIGDMSLVSQAKLLRVLQSGEIRRVGESTVSHIDVRILAATNRDLLDDVREKRFREDVYFRLNVVQILIPPLRERPDAITSLAKEFLKRFNAKFNKTVQDIDDQAWGLLMNYGYPGNVRELESTIAHAVILTDHTTIGVDDLPDHIRFGSGMRKGLPLLDSGPLPTLEEMEKQLIERSLTQLNGNQTEAAKQLGISRSTLWRKMKEYNIPRPGEAVASAT